MEEILGKLLVADNAVIQQASKELREAFKSPDVIPSLCNVVGVSQNPQIRQYAAVLLRKRLSKNRNWTKLSVDVRNGIKQGILQALISEPEKFVKNAIAQFIGTIIRHEFGNQGWPEVLQFITQLTSSDNDADKELGMYTLSIITEMSAEEFLCHAPSMAFLFSNTLTSLQDLSSPIAYYTVITMMHFVPLIQQDQGLVNVYHQLMPRIMQVVKALAVSNEDRACAAMEIFEDLLEAAVTVIVPHLKAVIEMCLEFASNKAVGDSLRVKALSLIGWIARTKKKVIIKHKLLEPILSILFQLMSVTPENEDKEDYFCEDEDATTPMTCANQTLDLLALYLPADRLLPPLMQHIQGGLEGTNPYAKKASYLALAVIVEGCKSCIRTKYLELFLQCICKGITDPARVVRNAALFALGQFSEHLQPEISQYASQLLPVLFEYLAQICSQLQDKGKEPPGVDRMFYALEVFCENLGEDLLPYLPTLMERLFTALNPNNSVHLRELALCCIGATANAAQEGMVLYFPQCVEHLKVYLTQEQTKETMCLQTQSVETLGILARCVGPEHFAPLAQESVQLGLQLLSKTDDPDLRKSCYRLFAALSTVLKGNMEPILPTLVETMLDALKSTEGIVPHYKDDEINAFPICEDLSEASEEEDIENEIDDEEEDDFAGYSVENEYIEEKEEACMALTEIAKNTGDAFNPYLEKCFEEIYKVVNYPQDEIRKAAVDALVQFCISFHKMSEGANKVRGKEALLKGLSLLIPKCAELIQVDQERNVVMAALDAYSELLKEVKHAVIEGEGHLEAIVNCVKDVLAHRTLCQGTEEEEEEEEATSSDSEAESDEMLIEYAGDIIPALGKVLTPDRFAQYFSSFLPHIMKRTYKQCTVSQRSFAVGTLSECMEPLGPNISQYASHLMPIFLHCSKDESDEVRNNAIFGIGEMVLHGKEVIFDYYMEILQGLSSAASKEKHAGTLDNICGALAKLIKSNVNGVPMEQVFPVFVNYLPLREDFEENKAVFECMMMLYQMGHPMLRSNLPSVIKAGLMVLCDQQGSKETLDLILNLMRSIQRDFPDQFNEGVSKLPEKYATTVQQHVSS